MTNTTNMNMGNLAKGKGSALRRQKSPVEDNEQSVMDSKTEDLNEPPIETHGIAGDPYQIWLDEMQRYQASLRPSASRADSAPRRASPGSRASRGATGPGLAEVLMDLQRGGSRPVRREETAALAQWLRTNYPDIMEEYAAHPYKGRSRVRRERKRPRQQRSTVKFIRSYRRSRA